ncbi:Tat binding protein 1-interacting [Decorospora gaudefroyi]|uniref:Tat binding protein 1-interacting n=1 Tax=Decorospora gaudefroyi TaxID=184978 RepID=A0A6A5K7V3_9PLEO|nr:Tat binding protein 1-interacting [Decorospora gaudefroyi]
MAPRKKTEEKASANEAADMVLHYLRKQNRPYSAIDVSANLHNKVTKAATAKILKDLHEQKLIEGRAAGKQIVYHALQNAAEAFTTEELAALDTTILNLRTQTSTLATTSKHLRTTLSTLNTTLRTADLVASVRALESEKADISTRLDALRKGKAKKVSPCEREAVEREWKFRTCLARKRGRIVVEMWRVIGDVLPDGEAREEARERFDLDA